MGPFVIRRLMEERLGLKTDGLKAIVYIHTLTLDEDTIFTVYGMVRVALRILRLSEPGKPRDIRYYPWDQLQFVPRKGLLVDASFYGFKKGKVLVIKGPPPPN